MQLFITEYTKKGTTITIADSELLSQIRKVLRARIGDTLRVQSPLLEPKKTRYELRIEVRDTTTLEGTIMSEQTQDIPSEQKNMIIAMPNKWDKAELIVQKLTECGLDQIIFWPGERSVIKERNDKKEDRLRKIIKEAVEQSRGRKLPKLVFTLDITTYIQNTALIVFDILGTRNEGQGTSSESHFPSTMSHITGVVGPEGGLTARDYEIFAPYSPKIVSLGTTVLRMETAAIIGGWIVKDGKLF